MPIAPPPIALGDPLDQAVIRTLIPHAGAMCLLDAVSAWDEDTITCLTTRHRDPTHPLRRDDHLAALHAFEYGAQAAAVHGSLCAHRSGQTVPPGYLAAIREARWFVAALDTIAAPLEIFARCQLRDAGRCSYAIRVSAADRLLAEGRIVILPRPDGGAGR